MTRKFRALAAGGIAALLVIALPPVMTPAEEKAEASCLSQFTASDYVDIADYDRIPVQADKNDTEGIQNDIGKYLESRSTFKKDLPKPFVDRNTDALKEQLQAYADQYDMPLAEFMKFYDSSLTEDTYESYIGTLGLTYSRKLVALQAVADAQGLAVTDDELETYLEETARAEGYGSVWEYEEAAKLTAEEIREMLMSQRVLEFLEDHAVFETSEKE